MKTFNKLKVAACGVLAVAAMTVANALPTHAAYFCPDGTQSSNGRMDGCTETVTNANNKNNLMSTVNTIINVIIGVVGFVAVVIIIMGGISYTTSAGDPGKVKKAKDTILYGIVGLVIALLAFAIVNFILGSVFNPGGQENESAGAIVTTLLR